MRTPDIRPGEDCRHKVGRHANGTGSVICLFLIAALALAIRLYHIGQQSVWIDEFFSGCFGVEELPAQLALRRFCYPDCTPLDFFLQHFWAMLVGLCPWKLRLLPIFFSILCVPMIFLLGKNIWGKRVGLLAALFFALSPFHVWYGQALRPYALMGLLALLAMYSCLRIATGGGRKWWFVNLTSGLLLLWTHPFAIFLLGAEFIFFLCSIGPRRVLLFVWTPLTGAAALSAFLWLSPVLIYVPSVQDDPDYQMPSPAQIAVAFLGNDAVLVNHEFPTSPPNLPFLTPAQCGALQAVHSVADILISAVFGLALALAVAFLFAGHQRGCGSTECRAEPASEEYVQRTGVVLLLCVALLPVLQNILMTLFWRPCFQPRFTLYCSFPLYLLLAAALLRIRRPILLGVALTLVLSLYGYQIAIFTTANTRTDWVSAASQIRTDLRCSDLVLITGILPSECEIFCLNAGELSVPVEPAFSPQEVCERVQQRLTFSATAPAGNPRVWVAIEGVGWDKEMLSAGFDAFLQPFGISHKFWYWPGMMGMNLYLFERTGPAGPTSGVPSEFHLPIDYEDILEQLGPRATAFDRGAALDALRHVLYWRLSNSLVITGTLSLMLTEKGYPEFGLVVARAVIDREPAFGYSHLAEATALASLGSPQEAYDAFQEAFALDRAGLSVFEPAIRAWFVQRDSGKARNELDKLKSIYPTRALYAIFSGRKEVVP